MGKLKWFIIFLVLIVICLVLFFLFKNFLIFIKLPKDTSSCSEIKGIQLKNICYLYYAEKTKNIDFCNYINVNGDDNGAGLVNKYECFTKLISVINDIDICKTFSPESSSIFKTRKDRLSKPSRDACYSLLAIKNKKSEYCDLISYKDDCYYGSATNESTCEKIKSFSYKNACYSLLVGMYKDISMCDKIIDDPNTIYYYNDGSVMVNHDRYLCYRGFAIDSKNFSFCNDINDELDKNFCFREIGYRSLNKEDCERVPNETYKSQCYENIIIETGDKSLCPKVLNSSLSKKNFCSDNPFENGIFNLDVFECDKVSLSNDAAICYFVVGVSKKDLSICDKAPYPWDDKYAGICYSLIAFIKDDLSICDRITKKTNQAICYFKLGQIDKAKNICNSQVSDADWCNYVLSTYNDPCSYVGDVTSTINCYYAYAIATKDKDYCDFEKLMSAKDDLLRKKCIKNIDLNF